MLTISGLKKFYFVPDINDMSFGAHRLLEIVKHKHHLNTSNGDVFIFMSKNQRTVKMVNLRRMHTMCIRRLLPTDIRL